ncbi:hypothetical protein B1218_38340, partial [Pseudomonas ogarae]
MEGAVIWHGKLLLGKHYSRVLQIQVGYREIVTHLGVLVVSELAVGAVLLLYGCIPSPEACQVDFWGCCAAQREQA